MWYKILDVSKNASKGEIESAYYKKINDPKNSYDMEKSMEIRNAYKEGMKQFSTYDTLIATQRLQPSQKDLYQPQYTSKNKKMMQKLIKIFMVSIIVSVLVFVTIGYLVNNNFFIEKSNSEVKHEDITIRDCLKYNFKEEKYKSDYAYSYLSSKDYTVNEKTRKKISASKMIDDKRVDFEFEVVDGYSKCTIIIEEDISANGMPMSRSIITTGNTLDVFEIQYRFTKEGNQLTPITQKISTVDTIESYVFYDKKNYTYSPLYDQIDEQKDIELRNVMVKALEDFK